MLKVKWNQWLLGISLAAIVFFVAACSGDQDGKGKEDTSSITGEVVIDGSGTVFPLMSRIAEEYMMSENDQVSVEVSRAGTSAGFKKFLEKDGTDFNNASREMKEEEREKAEALDIEVKELKVALDGLTFVTHKDNDWANELTPEQLIAIFKADSGVTKWSDLDPAWPDEEISPMGPNENHGTYEFFYENVLDKQDLADHVHLNQEYSTLVKLVSDDKNGIAFFGFGYYESNKDKLQAVHVDFGDGPVEPSLETISEDGPYQDFTRPVFTYLNVNHAKEKAQVLDFAQYVMNNVNTFASDAGFAPIPEEEAKANVEALEQLK